MGDSSGEECALQIDVGKSEAARKGAAASEKKKKTGRPPVNWTPGEVVWAKVSGFSFWPAKVFDADNDKLVPQWIKPAPRPTYILVRFFGTYDMQWVSGTSAESYVNGLKKKFHKKCRSKSFLKAIEEAKLFVDNGVIPDGLTQRPLNPNDDMETDETEDKSNTSQEEDSSPQSGATTTSGRTRRKRGPAKKCDSPSKKKKKIESSNEDGESKEGSEVKGSEVKAFTSAPLPQSSKDNKVEEEKKETKNDKNATSAATDDGDNLTNGGATSSGKTNEEKPSVANPPVPVAES